MLDASSYWAGATNGNGNGKTNHEDTGGTCNNFGEHMYSWAHMASAGIISGSYPYGDADPVIGTHVPASPFGSYAFATLDENYLSFPVKNTIALSSVRPKSYYRRCTTSGGNITAVDARAIDKKLDDGFPETGNVRASNGTQTDGVTWWTTCHTANSYDITESDPACVLFKFF